MEICVNEYVRTQIGIFIISHINIDFDDNDKNKCLLCQNEKVAFTSIDYIKNLKHSKNIIDLVEVGDYVNGYKVISADYDVIDDKTECIELDLNNNYQYNFISARQIKTIITKEQMQSIEYKVEEDKLYGVKRINR